MRLPAHQIVNLSLAAMLLFGIAATTYTVTNLSNTQADAARGGKNPIPATITVNQTGVHFGDTITFTTTGGGRFVQVVCYQTLASIVYNQTLPVGSAFLLTPENLYGTQYNPAWNSDCVAYLKQRDRNSDFLAMTGFVASPQQ